MDRSGLESRKLKLLQDLSQWLWHKIQIVPVIYNLRYMEWYWVSWSNGSGRGLWDIWAQPSVGTNREIQTKMEFIEKEIIQRRMSK